MTSKFTKERNAEMRRRMVAISEIKIGPLPKDSPWLKPVRLHYIQDGRSKIWDTSRAHDSVSIIVYNTSRQKLVLVRQFRPASYFASLPGIFFDQVDLEKYPPSLGLSLELCAGIVDKDKPLVEIARDELREECGYEAPSEDFILINTFRYIADSSAFQTIYYVEVTDEQHVHEGGGSDAEGELIEVVEMSLGEAKEYIGASTVQSPPAFLYGITWFFLNKA